jgi:hypothetical protein
VYGKELAYFDQEGPGRLCLPSLECEVEEWGNRDFTLSLAVDEAKRLERVVEKARRKLSRCRWMFKWKR